MGAYEGLFLAYENSIPNSEVSHEVCLTLSIKLDLEVATPMLFCCLVVLRGDHKIVDNVFLNLMRHV